MVHGWPFLIARGRRRGYEVLLAPDFLVAGQEYGFLEEVAGPARHGPAPSIAGATTPGGRAICLVWTEYVVRGNDLGTGEADPVDEHSRPLLLLQGFLCAGARVLEPSAADLDHAHRAALDCYRGFLADEEGFTVRQSSPFETTSVCETTAQTSPERVTLARHRGIPAVLGAAVVIAAVVLLGIALFRPAEQAPPPPTCTPVTVTPLNLADTSSALSTTPGSCRR
jgi:hypothetical protein